MNNTNPIDWEFEFQQRGGQPILQADFWCQALHSRYPHEIDLDIRGFDYLMTSENKGYYLKGQRQAVLEKFKERLSSDPTYLPYIFDQTKKRFEEFSYYMKSGNFEWEKFTDHVLNLVPWFYIPWYITEFNFISDRVISGLDKYKTEIETHTDLNNAAMTLMFPDQEMGFQEEQRMFYQIVEDVKAGKNPNIQDYLQKYDWVKTFILVPTEPLNEDGLKRKIKTAIEEKTDETYRLQLEKKAKDKELVSRLESIIKSDETLLSEIRQAKYLAWLLTWSVETAMRAFSQGIPWYKEIAKSIGLEYEDWVNLTINEVRASIQNGSCVITRDELSKRKSAHILKVINGDVEIISGEEAADFIDQLKDQEKSKLESNIKEITGKPASPGKVVGKVKICLSAESSHIVEEGNILVCSMTTPDYVPAMKKAGAIVTDEGGLLCHAAIISRELNKPCVIATKIATHALKTGDMVEVDANNGIVKILK